MSKIFKPRRGKASTMLGTKSSTVLAAGEMFIEVPDTGVGTGVCKMKMGDGVTAYSSLPYAMGGDIASTEITGSIVEDSSTSAETALANVTTGRTLGAIIGSLRKACQLNAASIKTLNDEAAMYHKFIFSRIGQQVQPDTNKEFISTYSDLKNKMKSGTIIIFHGCRTEDTPVTAAYKSFDSSTGSITAKASTNGAFMFDITVICPI